MFNFFPKKIPLVIGTFVSRLMFSAIFIFVPEPIEFPCNYTDFPFVNIRKRIDNKEPIINVE